MTEAATLAELTELEEGIDVEVKRASGKDGRGEVPRAFFETYAAMANTDGGVIYLGIAERGGQFIATGIGDVPRVRKALWDGLNNRKQVSRNLLRDEMVSVVSFGAHKVIKVQVPRATRHQRPVYVGENPLAGSSWSGNLFDFYRIVIQKLGRDLRVPFRLERGTDRVDETPVHEALREALVNTLIHADFSGRASVLVVKRPDMFGFRNPGLMRVPVASAIAGGNSDCRNRNLQKLFQLVGSEIRRVQACRRCTRAGASSTGAFQSWKSARCPRSRHCCPCTWPVCCPPKRWRGWRSSSASALLRWVSSSARFW